MRLLNAADVHVPLMQDMLQFSLFVRDTFGIPMHNLERSMLFGIFILDQSFISSLLSHCVGHHRIHQTGRIIHVRFDLRGTMVC